MIRVKISQPPFEFSQRDVDGAGKMAKDELVFGPHIEPVILVCRTDKRSANAAKLLHEAGFRDVHVLRGGMERWNQNGLPVEGGGDM